MELMFRSVVSWYKMSFMVYFEFWFDLVKRILMKIAKTGHFCFARHPYT